MERKEVEVCDVEELRNELSYAGYYQLNELQLALVGGGIGDTIL